MSQYEHDITIHRFLGLYQDGDGVNLDPKYAVEAVNMDTAGGVLAPAARHTHLLPELPAPIGTLMRLFRRWMADDGSQDLLVVSSGGRLYYMSPDGHEWEQIIMPPEIELYQSDKWSWTAYELNERLLGAPVDALLLSNARDGMILVRGDTMTAQVVGTPKKFGIISRHAERIWGGAIPGDPDMLCYSAPFDPTDWQPNAEHPEDGAGDISQPSWDGDSFTALVPFGSQLIALKKNRIWRILGNDPSQYTFREQYGGGARYTKTVIPIIEQLYMLGTEGILRYDGLAVQSYYPENARDVFARMNKAALSGATACTYKMRYYVALPLDGADHNNAVLIHDLEEKSWLLREGVTVADFLPTDDALYFTNIETPGRVCKWGEDALANGAEVCRWASPWIDLNRRAARYGGWTLYLSVQADAEAELHITIRTEKRQKTKTVRIAPGVGGEGPRQRQIRFGGNGRRFQLEIASRDSIPWKMVGGLQIRVEIDPD